MPRRRMNMRSTSSTSSPTAFSRAMTVGQDTPCAVATHETERSSQLISSTRRWESLLVILARKGNCAVVCKNERRSQAGSWQAMRHLRTQRFRPSPPEGRFLPRCTGLAWIRVVSTPQEGQVASVCDQIKDWPFQHQTKSPYQSKSRRQSNKNQATSTQLMTRPSHTTSTTGAMT